MSSKRVERIHIKATLICLVVTLLIVLKSTKNLIMNAK